MSQSILRSGIVSPARAAFASSKASRPRSILKRPAALPLSPTALPFHASFSVMVSPSIKSPHVQFINTPSLLSTYSSENYDRAPIKVSPNPLAIPERGSRYYSPTVDHFKLSAPPKPKAAAQKRLDSILKASQQCASPAITDFADPRSPKAPVAPVQQQIRFASFAATSREPQALKQSISSYPRSPYPSAPLSPSTPAQATEERARRNSDVIPPLRSQQPLRLSRTPVLPSPLKSSFASPSLQRSHRPAPLDLNPSSASDLSNAFWDAVTLEGETPMVTALEYPESATVMEEIDLKSPAPALKSPGPQLMFGNQDGSVWSPTPASAVPKKHAARETLLRSALMSPAKAAFAKPAAKPVKHSFVASPSPNDPFASFPSFSAVLSLDGGLAVPPRVAVAA
jgi:hypothetical protein